MPQTTLVKKASGEKEPFSQEKLENSLKRVGADDEATGLITDKIQNWLYEGVSTKKIYKQAFRLLKKHKSGLAARYQLRKAIMELGPTGYPFEHFVGQLIRHMGYEIKVGQILQGYCVKHEVDVVAINGTEQIFVECKFYNSQGKHANVQVPLYIRSRVEDIVKYVETLPETSHLTFKGWIVTNTRFTTDAADYGKCAGLHLIGWDYPKGHSLKDMIEKEGFFPVTTLTSMNRQQKQILMDEGTVLVRQLCQQPEITDKLEINPERRKKITEEVKSLCNCFNCN